MLSKWKQERAYRKAELSKAKQQATKAYYEEHAKARIESARQIARLEQEQKIKVLKKQYAEKLKRKSTRPTISGSISSIQKGASRYQGGGLMGMFGGDMQQPVQRVKRRKKVRKKQVKTFKVGGVTYAPIKTKRRKARRPRPQPMITGF